jgi:hypothetical protein
MEGLEWYTLLAKQVLSQVSYTPIRGSHIHSKGLSDFLPASTYVF